jgi:hypothetical protein
VRATIRHRPAGPSLVQAQVRSLLAGLDAGAVSPASSRSRPTTQMRATPDRSVIAAAMRCGSRGRQISLARIPDVPLDVVMTHASEADRLPASRRPGRTPACTGLIQRA